MRNKLILGEFEKVSDKMIVISNIIRNSGYTASQIWSAEDPSEDNIDQGINFCKNGVDHESLLLMSYNDIIWIELCDTTDPGELLFVYHEIMKQLKSI